MKGSEAVTALATYLQQSQDVQVFKYEKSPKFSGEYIVVNSLPFSFGSAVNINDCINVNIHVPDFTDTQLNAKRLSELSNMICNLIPKYSDAEDDDALEIEGCYYAIISDSNYMADTDNTHFINFKILVTSNN